MKILCQCPSCGQQFQFSAEWAGTHANCPKCAYGFQLPAAQPAGYGAQKMAASAWPPPSPHAAANSLLTNPMVWMVGGGTLVAVMVLLGLMIFVSSRLSHSVVARPAPPATASIQPMPPPTTYTPAPSNYAPVGAVPTIAPKPLSSLPPPPPPQYTSPAPPPTTTSYFPLNDDPPKTKPAVAPPKTADWENNSKDKPGKKPAAGGGEWEGAEIVSDGRSEFTFGPPGCPVVISGKNVWSIADRKIRAEINGKYDDRGNRALSPDGETFVAVDKSEKRDDAKINVWDTHSGLKKFDIACGERGHEIILVSNDKLLLCGRDAKAIDVWNIADGSKETSFELPDTRLDRGKAGLTLDGKYLAAPSKDRMTVFRTTNGKMAAVMGLPRAMDQGGLKQAPAPSAGPKSKKATTNYRVDADDAPFVFAWTQSVKFSADSLELAAVSTHPRQRIMCWDNRGKLIYDEPFFTSRRAFWNNTLQWFPDRQAWLIEHDIFDREAGKIVLSIRKAFAQDLEIHVFDDEHLVGTFPHNPKQVETLEIPWKQIRASLAAMNGNAPALLSPSSPVSIALELGELRGDQAETVQKIESALVNRLSRDGLKVEAGRSTFFRLKFAEKAGDRLAIYERQSMSMFDKGRDTGRSATEAKGTLVVELIVPGREEPIWRETINAGSSTSFREEINDAVVRKSMLDRLTGEINELSFPYYIPSDDQLLALPIIVQ